jgi:hypothetical protein
MAQEVYTCRAVIVCPAALKDVANAYAKANLDPVGGENTFRVALTADGDTVAAYWASIACRMETYNALSQIVPAMGGRLYDGMVFSPDEILQTEGLSRWLPPQLRGR